MIRSVTVRALPKYRIYVRFSDSAEGQVDLSDFVGKELFAPWHDREFFRRFTLANIGRVRRNDDIELCPDAIYMRLTGKTPAAGTQRGITGAVSPGCGIATSDRKSVV